MTREKQIQINKNHNKWMTNVYELRIRRNCKEQKKNKKPIHLWNQSINQPINQSGSTQSQTFEIWVFVDVFVLVHSSTFYQFDFSHLILFVLFPLKNYFEMSIRTISYDYYGLLLCIIIINYCYWIFHWKWYVFSASLDSILAEFMFFSVFKRMKKIKDKQNKLAR